jgi:hypothetical protein
METQQYQSCQVAALINDINSLNSIASPTDGEEHFIEYIANLIQDAGIHFERITPKQYLKVSPLLIGNPNAKYILVAHCDRYIDTENPEPLAVCNNFIKTVEGKLDNTVSLSVCVKLMMELKPQNTSLLVTTGEEGRRIPQIPGGDPLQRQGGRGFISYLQDNYALIQDKYFICIDVRPLDRGGVLKKGKTKKFINLGDGLVLRTREVRDNVDISTDIHLLNTVKQCALHNNITLTEFSGAGITELGRGWEKVLQPNGYPVQNYHVAWVQPPITQYHTKHEQMSGNDIVDLCKVIYCLIESFEQN